MINVLVEDFSTKSTIAIFRVFPGIIGDEELENTKAKLTRQGYTRLYYISLFPECEGLSELSEKQEEINKSFPGEWDQYISQLLEPFISHVSFDITMPEDEKLRGLIEERLDFVKRKIEKYGIKTID